ncbi:uncharacterized protein CDAR_499351 [Caerostris darwini]|uniref:Uncharacterized protein n=1 Tax=Caerostris darwini TaxID=1538125 RepID=A0AAV4P2F4_9ARAC|nr:uncharacterized protein CDAR_499351 [Caerostris darwini]
MRRAIEMSWMLAGFLIILTGFQSIAAASIDCDSSEYVVCREGLEDLKRNQQDYLYTDNEDLLNEMCSKQRLVLNCVSTYAEECLSPEEKSYLKLLVHGVDDFIYYFCTEDSFMRKEYIKHSPCIKTVSPELDKCTETYTEAQKRIERIRNPDVLLHRTCCSYVENLWCSQTAVSQVCGRIAGTVTWDVMELLGGSYLNKICKPFLEEKTCHPTQRSNHFKSSSITTRASFFSTLFPFLYRVASHYLGLDR